MTQLFTVTSDLNNILRSKDSNHNNVLSNTEFINQLHQFGLYIHSDPTLDNTLLDHLASPGVYTVFTHIPPLCVSVTRQHVLIGASYPLLAQTGN